MLENVLTFTCTIIINLFFAYLLLFTESCNFFSNCSVYSALTMSFYEWFSEQPISKGFFYSFGLCSYSLPHYLHYLNLTLHQDYLYVAYCFRIWALQKRSFSCTSLLWVMEQYALTILQKVQWNSAEEEILQNTA